MIGALLAITTAVGSVEDHVLVDAAAPAAQPTDEATVEPAVQNQLSALPDVANVSAKADCYDYAGNPKPECPPPAECEISWEDGGGYFFATDTLTIEIFVDSRPPGCPFDEVRFTGITPGVNEGEVSTTGPFDGFRRSQQCSAPQDLQFELELLLNGQRVSSATPTIVSMDFVANCAAASP